MDWRRFVSDTDIHAGGWSWAVSPNRGSVPAATADRSSRGWTACSDYLYGREYRGRGIRGKGEQRRRQGRPRRWGRRQRLPLGGDADSLLSIPDWIQQVRELFPNDTAEIIQRHALDRYGMTELVTDAEVLKKMEPSYELLKAILSFKGMMSGEVLELARKIVRQVIDDLRRRLAKDVRQALWGRLNKQRRSRLKVLRNLDWRRTIRANLKNYDRQRKQIVLRRAAFLFPRRSSHALAHHHGRRLQRLDDGLGDLQRRDGGHLPRPAVAAREPDGLRHGRRRSLRERRRSDGTADVGAVGRRDRHRRGAFLLRDAGPHRRPARSWCW